LVLQSTGDWLKGMLPDDPESTILRRLKRPKGDEQDAPDAPPPETRSDLGSGPITGSVTGSDPSGYGRSDRNSMRQLIEGRTTTAR
jgi:membrane protein required for colicin V production